MKNFNLKIGGIKQMLSKDQMKKITGGYSPCEHQSTIGAQACAAMGGYWLICNSGECGSYNLCNMSWAQGC